MPYFRTFYGFAYVVLTVSILIPIGLLLAVLRVTPLKKAIILLTGKIGQVWGRGLINLLGINPTVSGRENIIKRGGMCFVSNHCGIFDIILLLAYAERPFGFIAKKELSFVPIFNVWILLLGGLFIDRKNPRQALKTISRGARQIRKGGCLLIFPEGTRSKGRGLLPFRQGSFKLALESAMPVVPVAISGTYEFFEKTGIVTRSPVSISFGQAISIRNDGDSKRGLAQEIHRAIENMLTVRACVNKEEK